MRTVVVTGMLAILVVSGCQTMTPEERRAADEERCRSYGFRTGTDAFAECLLHIDLDRRAASRQLAATHDPFFRPVVVYRPVVMRPRPRP